MPTNKQQAIVEAIQNGARTYQEIVDATGITYSAVANNLGKLYVMHNVLGLAQLRQVLPPRYVKIDVTLPPERAANLLVQVLGVTYCALLASALLNELKN